MPRPIRFAIPLPPPELWPGAHQADQRKARVTTEYRTAVCALAIGAVNGARPRWTGIKVRATFWFGDRRRREPRDLQSSLDSAFDALVDAGVIDASHVMIRLPPHQWPTQKRPCVMLSIEPLANDEEDDDE